MSLEKLMTIICPQHIFGFLDTDGSFLLVFLLLNLPPPPSFFTKTDNSYTTGKDTQSRGLAEQGQEEEEENEQH